MRRCLEQQPVPLHYTFGIFGKSSIYGAVVATTPAIVHGDDRGNERTRLSVNEDKRDTILQHTRASRLFVYVKFCSVTGTSVDVGQ